MAAPFEPSSHIVKARNVLDVVIQAGEDERKGNEVVQQVPIAEARTSPLLQPQTGRSATRVLIITNDTSLVDGTTHSLDGFLHVSDVFDEVHILVMRVGLPVKEPVVRVADNVWLYVVSGKHAWHTPVVAWRLILDQFVFAEGFRPDVIIARDPYESALVAMMASRYFDRPAQLHVMAEQAYLIAARPRWQRWLRHFLLPKFTSIRTETAEQISTFTNMGIEGDVDVLPRFQSFTAQFDGSRTNFLHEKYQQFNFIVLYVGALEPGSTAFNAIDAMRGLFRNPRVGMVMVGDGPMLADCRTRATLLGITEQIIFERSADNLVAYLQSADALLVTDQHGLADDMVLRGAAAGLAMVMTNNDLRQDLFSHEDTAYLVPVGQVSVLEHSLGRLLNDPAGRHVMGQKARRVAETRLHADPVLYQKAYQESIERAIITYHEVA